MNGAQGGYPPVDENQISSHSPDDYSTTTTNPTLGEKRKISEKYEKSQTKRKVNQSFGVVGIIDIDYNLIYDRTKETTNEKCKKVDERHIELVTSITHLMQMLCTAVKEV